MENIPSHKPRPLRFSLRLVGLCFGFSFAVHAAVLTGLMLTEVPPASAWASKASEAPDGEQHVVTVTFTMKMTNFAPTPAQTKPVPQEKSDRTPPPPAPTGATGDPNGQHTDTLTPSTPTDPPPNKPDPDPNATAELILQELLSQPKPINTQQQPLAPLPKVAEQLDQPPPAQPRLAKTNPQAELLENFEDLLPDISEQLEQLEQASEQQPNDPASDTQPVAPVTEPSEPTEQTKPAETQPTPPPSTDATASDAEEQDEQDDRPTAKVYDEDSVDQPIAFKKKVRPVKSYKSKKFGDKGTIRILVTIDQTGEMLEYEVIDDANNPRLLTAAIKALKASTFVPAILDGQPVQSTWGIEYQF